MTNGDEEEFDGEEDEDYEDEVDEDEGELDEVEQAIERLTQTRLVAEDLTPDWNNSTRCLTRIKLSFDIWTYMFRDCTTIRMSQN